MADSFEEGTASGPAAPSALRRFRSAGGLAREGHWLEDWHWQQANWLEGAADEPQPQPQPQLSACLPGWVSRRQKALVEALVEKHAEDSKALLEKHAVEDSAVEGEDGAVEDSVVEDSVVEDRPFHSEFLEKFRRSAEKIPPLPPRPPPPRPSQKCSTEILEDLEEQLKELKEEGNQLSVLSGGPPIWNLEEEEAVIDWYSEEELQIKIADARAMISDLHRIKFMAQRDARELNRSRNAGPHRQDDMQEGSLHDV